MRRRKSARSAELVWSAACEFGNQVLRAKARGLRFSPKVQAWMDRAMATTMIFGGEALNEVDPAGAARTAREYRRAAKRHLAKAHPDKAANALRYARKLERIAKRVTA